MACSVLDTETCLDYMSIIHQNVYRMRINPDQRAMIKKYMALVDHELADNLGVPWPPTIDLTHAQAYRR